MEPPPPPLPVIKFGSTFGSKEVMIAKDSSPNHFMLMKTLEEIKAENKVVRERLDKQDEILKAHAGINSKIQGMLEAILAKLPS